jgi:hypothetical protein
MLFIKMNPNLVQYDGSNVTFFCEMSIITWIVMF